MLIKNTQTGLEFDLPKEDALMVINTNKGKFVVLDGTPVPEEETVKTEGSVKDLVKGDCKELEEMNIPELRAFAKAQDISLKGCGNDKAQIVARIKGE